MLEAVELHVGVWIERGVYDDTSTARISASDEVELEAASSSTATHPPLGRGYVRPSTLRAAVRVSP